MSYEEDETYQIEPEKIIKILEAKFKKGKTVATIKKEFEISQATWKIIKDTYSEAYIAKHGKKKKRMPKLSDIEALM
tara:strand:+ start:170 stop:400 length:231 start_codon:yes stop_codon:yes gene_type:complete